MAGPGTELKRILESIGISPYGCSCEEVAALMDEWGIEGCMNPSNFAYIVTQMEDNSKKYNWARKIAAAIRFSRTSLIYRINPLNPFPDLIREAIRVSSNAPGGMEAI